MFLKKKPLRLLLGFALGLAFFGCVGLPRRQPPLDDPNPGPIVQRGKVDSEKTDLIPDDPRPIEPPPIRRVSANSDRPIRPPEPDTLPREPVKADPPPPTSAKDDPDKKPSLLPPLLPPPEAKKAETPSSPPVPASPTPPDDDAARGLTTLRELHRAAVKRFSEMDGYVVRLTRREHLKGKMQPEEVVLCKFRKDPMSVYFKWVGPVGKGREVVFVQGRHDNKLHTLLAAGDVPLMPAGRRLSLSPDSALVRASCRHCITEAGIGSLIERFGKLLDGLEKNDTSRGTAVYVGKQKRPEFDRPADTVEWKVPPGTESCLPKGGKRWCYLDPETALPSLLITADETGQEVEYYRYDRFQYPIPFEDEDFDPEKLWPTDRRG